MRHKSCVHCKPLPIPSMSHLSALTKLTMAFVGNQLPVMQTKALKHTYLAAATVTLSQTVWIYWRRLFCGFWRRRCWRLDCCSSSSSSRNSSCQSFSQPRGIFLRLVNDEAEMHVHRLLAFLIQSTLLLVLHHLSTSASSDIIVEVIPTTQEKPTHSKNNWKSKLPWLTRPGNTCK